MFAFSPFNVKKCEYSHNESPYNSVFTLYNCMLTRYNFICHLINEL